MNDILKALMDENAKLKHDNRILSNQISIALDGFEVIISMGELTANVSKQTIQAMEECEKELPQDTNKDKD